MVNTHNWQRPGIWLGWYVDESRVEEGESSEEEAGLFSWLLGGEGKRREDQDKKRTPKVAFPFIYTTAIILYFILLLMKDVYYNDA